MTEDTEEIVTRISLTSELLNFEGVAAKEQKWEPKKTGLRLGRNYNLVLILTHIWYGG